MHDDFEMIPVKALVKIEDTPEFLNSVKKTSKYIGSLPISLSQIDTLTDMIIEMKAIRSIDAFSQGVEFSKLCHEIVERDESPEVLN